MGGFVADDPLPGLLPYVGKIDNGISALPRLQDWRRVGREAVEDAARDGLDHVELRFAPGLIARTQELAVEAVGDAVADGVRSSDHEVRVGLIGILVRTFGPETADEDLAVIRSRQDRFVLTAERAAARQAGLTEVEIRQAAVNARRMAFG